MSTLFGEISTSRFGPPLAGGATLHQWNSWQAAAPRRLIRLWAARRDQRRALGGLSAQQLDDIGLTRTQARREAAKPFWKR
jgi:uncharacterized protein YjiS (DUF1127 family)